MLLMMALSKTSLMNWGGNFTSKKLLLTVWGAVQMSQKPAGLVFFIVQFGQGYEDMSPPTK